MRAIATTLFVTLVAFVAPACGSSDTALSGGGDNGTDITAGDDATSDEDGGAVAPQDAASDDTAGPSGDAPEVPRVLALSK